jgi:hypothetical protein
VLVLGLVILLPSVAAGSPLLSGYGGPGQGEQAILGGGLVNGPSGGASGGGSNSISTAAVQGSAASAGSSSHGAVSHPSGRAHTKTRTGRHTEGASAGSPTPYSTTTGLASSNSSGSSAQLLGLSGKDIIYVVIALALLIATAMTIKRLAVRPGAGEPG